MSKSSARSVIRLRGVRQNNLKNFDLDLPFNQLIVVTGLSGSGKSSLAFDTLFAEGQRRYIETFSPYARQFLDRMDKPQVDSIEGIPPAIAIEQRNAVRTTRSTVGTMTEICDYMKMLWPHISQLHCGRCGRPVRKDSPQSIWAMMSAGTEPGRQEYLITFDLPVSEKLSLTETLSLVNRQGYQRLLVNGRIARLDEVESPALGKASVLTVLQDRIKADETSRPRFTEACEQAYHFGKGKLTLWLLCGDRAENPRRFSSRLHCAECDIEYRPPSPALFSFNHPLGACPKCRGFGRIISIDYKLAIPDPSRTLAQGVVKPWQTGLGAECQADLMRMCRHFEIPTDVPFQKLPKKWRDFVVEGEPDYGKDEDHEWPRAWYGVKGYFRWLESKAYKMHVRVLLSRYRAYTRCPDCNGTRFQPDALLFRCQAAPKLSEGPGADEQAHYSRLSGSGLTLADFYQLPIRDALKFIDEVRARWKLRPNDGPGIILHEARSRLVYLDEVGLGYLTLDRPTRTLSGGETERVNLTTCLGTRLVNTLYVLDEPSVGLHPRDTDRLIRVLERLRDTGNTVLVVEHEASVMQAADQIVDLGPGHGATGGEVVFQGTYEDVLRSDRSLTGQYLSRRKAVQIPARRPVMLPEFGIGAGASACAPWTPAEALALNEAAAPYGGARGARSADLRSAVSLNLIRQPRETSPSLKISNATLHNLKDITIEIPLRRLVCVAGVSGSGKTTLVREVLLPVLAERLRARLPEIRASDRLADVNPARDDENGDQDRDGESDSSTTPGTVEATVEGVEYLGRVVLVDQSILGKTPRSNPAVYIGAFDDIRDVFAASETARKRGLNASAFSFNSSQGQCERCRGAGYEKIEMQFLSDVFIRCPDCNGRRYRPHILEVKIGETKEGPWSIVDLLDATVDECVQFLAGFNSSKPASRAMAALSLLQEVGLGYLKLGQPINTLSGGESQRLKLVRHLAETLGTSDWDPGESRVPDGTDYDRYRTLFLFDEPTTGLHFADVAVLLKVFQRLVDAGHSVLVIEHNLDVIKSADWVIDLGPEAGDQGGCLVAQGTPEFIASCETSHTGRALRRASTRAGTAGTGKATKRTERAQGVDRRLAAGKPKVSKKRAQL